MDTITSSLPGSGRINCSLCHGRPIVFDETRTESEHKDWRITANPLTWGNQRPEVLVLGFSKGLRLVNFGGCHTMISHTEKADYR